MRRTISLFSAAFLMFSTATLAEDYVKATKDCFTLEEAPEAKWQVSERYDKDWIGIYPVGYPDEPDSYDYKNVSAASGTITFKAYAESTNPRGWARFSGSLNSLADAVMSELENDQSKEGRAVFEYFQCAKSKKANCASTDDRKEEFKKYVQENYKNAMNQGLENEDAKNNELEFRYYRKGEYERAATSEPFRVMESCPTEEHPPE